MSTSLKIMLLGDARVGKSSLARRSHSSSFSEKYRATIGIDFALSRQVVDEDFVTNLQIWDTEGANKSGGGGNFFKYCSACVLVFDITQAHSSYAELKEIEEIFVEKADIPNIRREFPFILLGNKVDAADSAAKAAASEIAQEFMQTHSNSLYFEVSAKDGTNVQEAFLAIATRAAREGSKSPPKSDATTDEGTTISTSAEIATPSKVLLKVIVVGDTRVGKTALINRYHLSTFPEDHIATIGADFVSHELTVDGKFKTLQIWDTAGMDAFQSLGTLFYKGSHACVLVFDVTQAQSSFANLKKHEEDFLKYAEIPNKQEFPFILLGNKVDAVNDAAKDAAADLAQEFKKTHPNSVYFEVSAKIGTNVQNAFLEVAYRASG